MLVNENLKWVLQALSCPAKIQISLFPEFVYVADELALCWEELYEENLNIEDFSPEVQKAFIDFDEFILSISGKENEHLWTNEALSNTIEWAKIRTLAKNALEELGWEVAEPGPNLNYQYIGGPTQESKGSEK